MARRALASAALTLLAVTGGARAEYVAGLFLDDGYSLLARTTFRVR
jgi:hypothetical protein